MTDRQRARAIEIGREWAEERWAKVSESDRRSEPQPSVRSAEEMAHRWVGDDVDAHGTVQWGNTKIQKEIMRAYCLRWIEMQSGK